MNRYLSAVFIAMFLALPVGSFGRGDGTIPEPLPKQRILVLGDSLTNGSFATHEQATFVGQLGALANAQTARRKTSRLPEIISVWNEVKVWKPDIVVLEFGLNDVLVRGTISDAAWKGIYLDLVRDIQSTGAKVIVCSMFWFGTDNPRYPTLQNHIDYNALIKEVSDETGALFADLWTHTQDCPGCISVPEEVSYLGPYRGDNFHPSDAGHRRIAEVIYGALVNKTFFPFVSNQ